MHRPHPIGRCFGRATLEILALALAAHPAWAGVRYLVRRDGTRIPLIQSTTELAVTFHDLSASDEAAQRFPQAGLGTITDFEDAGQSPVKLLSTVDASRAHGRLIAQDPAVKEVHPVFRQKGVDAPMASTGTINVRLRPGLLDAQQDALLTNYRVQLVEPIASLRDTYCVQPADAGDDEVLRAQAMAVDPKVVWAEPNFLMPHELLQWTGDRYYPLQWHLNNIRQAGGTDDADIDAPEAWALADGTGVIVGMFDQACDVAHEDLKDGYIGTGHDPALPTTDPGYTDPSPKFFFESHGTSVMGLIAARANGVGVRGVAYGARFTASRGLTRPHPVSDDATVYAFARAKNVDVHNNSWGYRSGVAIPEVVFDALTAAFTEGRDLDGPDGPQLARGMVVVFSAGNDAALLEAGSDLSTLPTVVGVGATDVSDQLTSYSNYGPEIDVVAPGGDFPRRGLIVTTDNTDTAFDPGYNVQGTDVRIGGTDIDPAGLYTGHFDGTSAAAPVVTGVAALILSANPQLTATDVRLILEHTCDKVSPTLAAYDTITSRSLKYGYGRVNAHGAVVAAQEALTNGGRTWPERPANVSVRGGQLAWRQGGDDLEFREITGGQTPFIRTIDESLALESDNSFNFIPEDGKCYDSKQSGCAAEISPLPTGVRVLSVGCGAACGTDPIPACAAGNESCVEYQTTGAKKYFAIYARSSIGRYSFGVRADNEGHVLDSGVLPPSGGGMVSLPGGVGVPPRGPELTISASPPSGVSPLTVRFTGNALTLRPIDERRTAWDFDIDDTITVNASTRNAQYTYTVAASESRTFIARLTMYDVDGNVGSAQTAIRVEGGGVDGGGTGADVIRIMIGIPGTVGSDASGGTSPFNVQLSVDTTGLTGTLQSIRWDLGDGTTAASLFVTHTYVNQTGSTLVLPINVIVTTETSGGALRTSAAARTITILPGAGAPPNTEPNPIPGVGPVPSQGGSRGMCGLGMLPVFVGCLIMLGLRRFSSIRGFRTINP